MGVFVVLQIREAKRPSLLQRLRLRPRQPQVRLTKQEIGNTFFYILEHFCHNGAVNWKTVYQAVGREAGRILLPSGVTPPAGSGISGYDSSEYRRLLLINAFLYCIRKVRPAELVVTLLDFDGLFGELALHLLRRAAAVWVVTRREDRYEQYNETAARMFGAQLILTGDTACVASSAAVLAPKGLRGFGTLPLHPFLFSPDGAGFFVAGDALTLPSPYGENRPEEIGRVDFAAALCERCRIEIFQHLKPDFLQNFYGKITPDELAKRISGLT